MRTIRPHKSRRLHPVEHRICTRHRRCFGTDRVDTRIGAAAFREFHDPVVDILLHETDRLGTGVSWKVEPPGPCTDGEGAFRAKEEGASDGKLTDRPAARKRDSLAALQIAE